MTNQDHLLTILSEECAETAQRVSKALRFGLNDIEPIQALTNAQRIVYEFNDIYAMMEVLHDAGLIDKVIDRDAIEKKKAKVTHYLSYSNQLGLVEQL